MRRLSGLESFFLAAETQTNLFHVGAVAVLDPSTAPAGSPPPDQALCRVLEDRMHLLAPFRRRLVGVPGGLDHARWIDDDSLDIRHHVIRAALPCPGGAAELARYAADVMGRPLDRDRPLWEIHVVEGMHDGLVAAVAKIHHAAIDGLTGVELTANLMDVTPETAPAEAPAHVALDRPPSQPALALEALRRLGLRAPVAVKTLARAAGAARHLHLHNAEGDEAAPPGLLDAPATPLGGRVSRRRAVAMASVDREAVDRVRAATGATVNDIVLALTSSALREHLEMSGNLPDQSLVAFVPVALRDQRGPSHDESVNRLSGMLVSLATSRADPVQRLAAVRASAHSAKLQDHLVGSNLFGSLADLLFPLVTGVLGRTLSLVGPRIGWPPFNVVVSSFAGSPASLYCGGSRLVAYYPLGPILDGSLLNVTVTSYCDALDFGFVACEDAIPDVDAIAMRIPSSMSELVKLTAA